jgi:hypothetical protein
VEQERRRGDTRWIGAKILPWILDSLGGAALLSHRFSADHVRPIVENDELRLKGDPNDLQNVECVSRLERLLFERLKGTSTKEAEP